MSSEEWKKFKFADILSVPLKNGLTKPTKVRGMGYKMVNMGELFANSIIGNIDMARVPMTESEIENFLLESYDLLFARQSLTIEGAGKCSIFKGNDEPTTFEGHLIRARVDKEIAVPSYLYYYFNSIIGINQIKSIVSVTAAAGIRSSDLGKLEILLPPLPTQCRIAEILSALDDKIELNRQINTTLEAIAQAIFKEWFVDFNYPGGTGELVKSEMGMIPKGWRVASLTSELNVVYGHNLPTSKLTEHGYPVFGGNGIIGFHGKYLYDEPQVIIACRGAASGKVNQTVPKSFVTNNSLIFEIPITSTISFPFLKYFCLNTDFCSFVSGSAQPQLTIENLKQAKLLVPEENIVAKFSHIVSLTEKMMLENNTQSKVIASTRDALLPNLLSGIIIL